MPHKNVRFSPTLVALLAGLGCALVLALVTLGFAPSLDPMPRALAADSARLEAKSMSESSSSIGVVNESAASGGMALKYVVNATASKTVALSSDATTLEIRARGTLVSGAWPRVRVFVDGTTYGTHDVATQSVNSSTYKVFSVPVNLKAGQHTVYVRGLKNVTSNRALYVDSLAFTFQQAPPPPPETTATPPPPPSGGPFPGIRWYPTMGVYRGAGGAGFVSEPNLIERQFADYVGPTKEDAYLDLDGGDGERYWFCGGRKYEWDDMLVDQSLAPTSRAQAQDPN
jgi:hypothetical protein